MTPNTPESGETVPEGENLWEQGDGQVDNPTLPIIEEEPEAEVQIDIVYQDIAGAANHKQTRSTTGYIAITGMFIVIVLLISVAICLYRKIIDQAD